jgi:hypothetical protein
MHSWSRVSLRYSTLIPTISPYAIRHSCLSCASIKNEGFVFLSFLPHRLPLHHMYLKKNYFLQAIFWPDFGSTSYGNMIWQVMQVPFIREAEFESGQMLIHRDKSWRALNLALYMNHRSDFYHKVSPSILLISTRAPTFHLSPLSFSCS